MIELDDTPQDANWLHDFDQDRAATNEFREAAQRLIAAYETTKKARVLDPLEAPMARQVELSLKRLRRLILGAFTLQEALPFGADEQKQAQKVWNLISDENAFKDFDKDLNLAFDSTNRAFDEGWDAGKEALIGQNPNLVGAFGMIRPEVLRASLKDRAAARVRNVTDTVRSEIRQVLVDSRVRGTSYRELSRAIATSSSFSKERAKLIAVTELADAYEEANATPSRMLAGLGFPMQKAWLLLGDEKVCGFCLANRDDGWIPEEESFSSGVDHPPQHPRCRCAADRRMDPNAEMPAVEQPPIPDGNFRTFDSHDEEEMERWGYGAYKSDPDYTAGGALKLATDPNAQVTVGRGGAYGEWANSLSRDEAMTFANYAGSSYSDINDWLAGDTNVGTHIPGMAKMLHDAIHQTEVPEDIVAWRGGQARFAEKARVGDYVDFPIFASSSLSKDVAAGFANSYGYGAEPKSKLVYKFLTPKGAKAAYLGGRLGMEEEHELLFAPDSSWKIIDDRIEDFQSMYDPGRTIKARQLTLEYVKSTKRQELEKIGKLVDVEDEMGPVMAEFDALQLAAEEKAAKAAGEPTIKILGEAKPPKSHRNKFVDQEGHVKVLRLRIR